MRIFSYIITALVTIFVINIALSFSLPSYRNILVKVRTGIFPSQADHGAEDAKNRENARLVESLDRIDKHIESLGGVQKSDTGAVAMSGVTDEGSGAVGTSSGGTIPPEDSNPKEPDVPLS